MAGIEAADTLPYALRISTLHRIALEVNRAGPNPATMLVLTYPLLAEVLLRTAMPSFAARRPDWPLSDTAGFTVIGRSLSDQLTPGLPRRASLDPFAGDGLLYRRLPDGVVIYSVGKDGVDDDGDVDMHKPTPHPEQMSASAFGTWPSVGSRPPPHRTDPDRYACRLYQSVVSRIPSSNGTPGR